MLKAIAAALGYVPLRDVQAAVTAAGDAVYAYTGAAHLPAWQLVAEPFLALGIPLRRPSNVPNVAPDMRREV